jgi:DNA-binding Lrp family transcriptional regulator
MPKQSNSLRPNGTFPALDRTDFAILEELQNNARLSNKELAGKLGLAPSSCLVRVRKLLQAKVLHGFHAKVDLDALGIGLQALIAVRLIRHSRATFKSLEAHIHDMPEVRTVYHLSGVNDLLVHVAVRDIAHLRDLIVDRLAVRPEVANCETSVIFSLFDKPRLPLYREPGPPPRIGRISSEGAVRSGRIPSEAAGMGRAPSGAARTGPVPSAPSRRPRR